MAEVSHLAEVARRVWPPTRARNRHEAADRRAQLAHQVEVCPLPGGRSIWAPDEVQPDWCTPLDEPDWIPVSTATLHQETDAVVGIVLDGRAWALPWWVMKNHHVANLVLDGRPWLVNFCEVCATAGLFEPEVDGHVLHWQVALIWRGAPVLRDAETGTLWQGLTMQPVQGELIDAARPTRHPVIQCTWPEWRAAYPDSLVVSGVGEDRGGHCADQVRPDHRHRAFARYKDAPDDPRLDQLALVLGVDTGRAQVTFPLDLLHTAGGVVTAELDGTSIVATARPGSWIANAFSAEVAGESLDLMWNAAGELEDRSTRTRWNAFGQRVGGPLDVDLEFIRSGIEKWFAWSGIFPDAPLYDTE